MRLGPFGVSSSSHPTGIHRIGTSHVGRLLAIIAVRANARHGSTADRVSGLQRDARTSVGRGASARLAASGPRLNRALSAGVSTDCDQRPIAVDLSTEISVACLAGAVPPRLCSAGVEPISMRQGPLGVVVVPEAGGALARFWSDSPDVIVDWLRPAPPEAIAHHDPGGMACFPLVPWSNRIRQGRALSSAGDRSCGRRIAPAKATRAMAGGSIRPGRCETSPL